jgi:hypothetical protein
VCDVPKKDPPFAKLHLLQAVIRLSMSSDPCNRFGMM